MAAKVPKRFVDKLKKNQTENQAKLALAQIYGQCVGHIRRRLPGYLHRQSSSFYDNKGRVLRLEWSGGSSGMYDIQTEFGIFRSIQWKYFADRDSLSIRPFKYLRSDSEPS